MTNFIYNSLSNLLDLFGVQNQKQGVWAEDVDLEQIIEHVVDVVDPKIRVISRYAQKLVEPVAHSWAYLNEVAEIIPDSMQLSQSECARDPRIKLLFESQEVMQKLLQAAIPMLNETGTDSSQRRSNIYMLLCMDKKERNFLGAELAGDIIKREVKQTAVTFGNHKLLSAGYVEEKVKQGFKQCAFEGLLHNIHRLVMHSHNDHKSLVEKKMQLRQQLSTSKGPNGALTSAGECLSDAHPELTEIEQKITDARIKTESPQQHLTQAIEVLSHPEKYLEIKKQSVALNNLGIKSENTANGEIFVIDYAEVEIEHSLKHIALVVKCPREELSFNSMH